MAVVIVNVSSTKFSIDGIEYLKNFQSVINGNNLRIFGVYDNALELVPFTIYSDFTVDGGGLGSAILLQSSLLNVLYNRNNIGTGDGYQIINSITDFNDLVTAGTSGIWLFLSTITMSASKTLPADVTLEFRNTQLNFGGFTLTGTNSMVNAYMDQIFDTSGIFAGTWKVAESNPLWFGAVGDGVADDTVAIQASINHFFSFNTFIPHGIYKISAPITIKARIHVRGQNGTHVDNCTILRVDIALPWDEFRGAIETKNYTDFGGSADFWHSGSIKNIQIDSPDYTHINNPEYGMVIFAGGEQSTVEGCAVLCGKIAPMFLCGFHAVLQVTDCSVRKSLSFGFLMTNHPDITFPNTGVAKQTDNGGSIRFYGVSADSMPDGMFFADGTQSIECSGLKSEFNNPVIKIEGSGVDTTRQRWSVTGFRSEHGVVDPVRAMVEINGTAKPQIFLGAGSMFNNTLIIDDNVSGFDIVDGQDGNMVIFDPYQSFNIVTRNMNNAPSQIIQKGSPLEDFASHRLSAQFDNDSSAYAMEFKCNFGAVGTYVWYLKANTDRFKFIEIDQPNGVDGISFNSWNGTSTMIPLIQFLVRALSLCPDATNDKLGFFGTTPINQQTIGSVDATDLASAITLVNELKAKIKALGIMA